MARATTAPVPVMTKNDAGPTGKSSGPIGKRAGAKATTRSPGGTKRAAKAKRQLGWEPRFPTYREGFAALLGSAVRIPK